MADPKQPPPRTALSAGGLPPDHPDALKPRKRTVKRGGVWLDIPAQVQPWIAEGRANIEDLEPDMFSRFVRRQTPENYDDITGAAAALFRAPQDENIRFGLKRTFDAVDQGLDPSRILSDPRRKKSLSAAEAELRKIQTSASEARKLSGLYAGAPTHDRMTFRYADGQDAFDVPPETGRIALSDPRYRASFTLIGAALGQGDQDTFADMARTAVRATAIEATTFDELAIDPVDTRVAIAAKTAQQLRSGALSPTEKKANLKLLTTTLFAEAMPETRAVRFLLDTVPGPGNIRSGERGYESVVAAKKALTEGDGAKALGHAFAAIFHGIGAFTGGKGTGALAAKVASKAPGANVIKASYDVSKARRQGPKPLPAQSLAKIAQPEDLAALTRTQERYASSVFNVVKGAEFEQLFRTKLETLGLKLVRGTTGNGHANLTIEIPGTKLKRKYDDAMQEKILVDFLIGTIPLSKKNWTTTYEIKGDASPYVRRQSSGDSALTDSARLNREKPEANSPQPEKADDMRGHNNPPERIDEKPTIVVNDTPQPANPISTNIQKVDQVILVRLPLSELNQDALVRAFERTIFSPKNAAMKRVGKGQWTNEDLRKIVEVVKNAEIKKRGGAENVRVGDLLAGIMSRVALTNLQDEPLDQD